MRGRAADQQLGGAADPEHLHLVGAEGGDADLRHPDGLVGDRLDLLELGGQSWIDHRFQSSGKPCTAMASRCSITP
jgi:hypothetical protein